ncbi:hypothetical protein GmHk_01G001506 [Glycine max]|nr:hypothetical protein GmHk_01G001506 [Glycine max]
MHVCFITICFYLQGFNFFCCYACFYLNNSYFFLLIFQLCFCSLSPNFLDLVLSNYLGPIDCRKIFIGGLARETTIVQFIKHLEIMEKTVQVWHLERREPQWQHMKGISWLWKLPLAGNRKCKSILRFTASNFRFLYLQTIDCLMIKERE